jgi:hypothetical protein
MASCGSYLSAVLCVKVVDKVLFILLIYKRITVSVRVNDYRGIAWYKNYDYLCRQKPKKQ